MTDIASIGDSILKVNSERIMSPYIIKAIGNQTYLESALFGKGGYIDELKDAGHEAGIEKSRKVKIYKYEGTINTKYIK